MTNRLPFLSQRIFNVPVAIHPAKAEVIIAALADRLGVMRPVAFDSDVVIVDEDDADLPDHGYDVVGRVALIEVAGTLVQKNGWLRPFSGMTGYDGIRQNLMTALIDPAVDAICFDIDSPGGEVAGCFDLVDQIFNARGEKPMWAILNENAYSAAYAIASACDKITVPRTGGTGSVGVVMAHVDFSKALKAGGVEVTFIQYGDRKTDGAAEKPLSEAALARFQADCDAMGELFVETVARNRGLSSDAVRGTQAATFMGQAGVALGLADAVQPPDAAFRDLLSSLG